MNPFKNLDLIFPVGAKRVSGEVVSVSVRVFCNDGRKFDITWKRKAWYVNASVNAYHLWRGLCRDFKEGVPGLTSHEYAHIRNQLASIVLLSYLRESSKSYEYIMELPFYNLAFFSFHAALLELDRGLQYYEYAITQDGFWNEGSFVRSSVMTLQEALQQQAPL